MASRNILTDVLLQGLTIAGIGVGAGVVFGVVFARGIGRYVAEVHLPGMNTQASTRPTQSGARVSLGLACVRKASS